MIGTGVVGARARPGAARLGVRGRLLQSRFERLGPFTDPECSASPRAILAPSSTCTSGSRCSNRGPRRGACTLRWREHTAPSTRRASRGCWSAAGRRPRVAGLGLETTGLALDASVVPLETRDRAVRAMRRSSSPAMSSGQRPLLHEAADEGRIAGANAARGPTSWRTTRRTPLAIAFTDPQMALVGVRFADLAGGTPRHRQRVVRRSGPGPCRRPQ